MGNHCCSEIASSLIQESVIYLEKFREYGIPIKDGGTSFISISYCPWCGEKLPSSLRAKWFDIVLDELNLDGPEDPKLPEEFNSDKWWNK